MAAVLIPSFILLMCFLISPSLQHVSESEPLVKFKDSVKITKGDLNSWKIGTDPCGGKWFGIYCHKGQTVTGIHITQLGLTGTIQVDDLKSLPNLKTVRLDNNYLSGPLPHFFKLRGLKSLMLSNNSFSGEIPQDFFKDLTKLKRLFLDHNQFVGKIPSSLMQLPNLEEIHLQFNKFSGEILPMTDINKSLKIVDFSNNELEGEVPVSLSDRKNLTLLLEENGNLCGKAVHTDCENVVVTPSGETGPLPPMSRPGANHSNSTTVYAIFFSITFLSTFLIVVSAIKKRNEKKHAQFRMLVDKERLSDLDAVQVKVHQSPAANRYTEPINKRGGHVEVGGGGGGEVGGGMSEIVMVNSDKGSFGLHHLMKAAAEVLGNGSLGSAYVAVMANGLSVVVKRIKDMNKLAPEPFDVGMRRLGKLRHPNVLTPLAYHYRREEKLVVSEYMTNSSLRYILHGDRGEYHTDLTWPTRLNIIKGVANGMQYLHEEFASYDLPHGNLKSSNVLLNENYEAVISDYAFSPFLEPNNAYETLFAYKTPEFALNQQVSQKSDVYCLGIIILEILTGKFPSQYGKGGTDIVQLVLSSMAEKKEKEIIDSEIVNSTTDSMQQMLELLRVGAACIASNPDERLDMRETVRRIHQVKT
ncbi:unnamed protein product [Eruca vesicaria subsp. sativa]|uniref:Protein kinase domain-containing protein n=1 Tax=Eruca vesicaria subsp. sativa TaxID=29727 RepID=A0ABC8L0Z4_ERUVS|nr:unnamed protein product [Eruca vesicaria subsp. sativa]